VKNEVSDALFAIGLRVLSEFMLSVNMLPKRYVPDTKPIVCPGCRTRCFDLSPSIHKLDCDVARMLRRAARGHVAK
jgi:hypothetical protein